MLADDRHLEVDAPLVRLPIGEPMEPTVVAALDDLVQACGLREGLEGCPP